MRFHFLVERIERTGFAVFHADADLRIVLSCGGGRRKSEREGSAMEEGGRGEVSDAFEVWWGARALGKRWKRGREEQEVKEG